MGLGPLVTSVCQHRARQRSVKLSNSPLRTVRERGGKGLTWTGMMPTAGRMGKLRPLGAQSQGQSQAPLRQGLCLPKTFPMPRADFLRALTRPAPTHTPVREMQTFWCVKIQAPPDSTGSPEPISPSSLPRPMVTPSSRCFFLHRHHRCGANLPPCISPRLGLDIGTTALTSLPYR